MNFRRVVTGHDSQGRSIIAQDAPAANLYGPPTAPYLINFWTTRAASGKDDPAEGDIPLGPGPGGATFRFFRVPPEHLSAHLDDAEQRRRIGAYYAEVGAPNAHVEGRHPGFHRTASVDYIVLLEGEVSLLVDEGEVDLRPFDVVVQRGTSHAWVNRGQTSALMMAVLVDDPESRRS